MCIHPKNQESPPPSSSSPPEPTNTEPINSESEPINSESEPQPTPPPEPAPESRKRAMTEPHSSEPNPKPKLHGAFSSSSSTPPPPPPPPPSSPTTTLTDDFPDPFVEEMFKNLPMPSEELNRQSPRSTLASPPQYSEELFKYIPANMFDDEPEPLNMIYPLDEGNYSFLDPVAKDWTLPFASNIDERISNLADPFDSEDVDVDRSDSHESNLRRRKVSAAVSPSLGYVPVDHADVPILKPRTKDVGAGIANLRNTCFIAAILQCLTHTEQFFVGLRYCCNHDPSRHDKRDFCAICAFSEHNDQALEFSRNTIYPWTIVRNVKKFSTIFVPHTQEDAHEFLLCALNKLRSTIAEEGLKYNLIEQIFGGEIVSRLQCRSCCFSSDTIDPIFDYSLVVDDVYTIQSALDVYVKVEDMDGIFKCSGCDKEVYMQKQLLIHTAPEIAILHLKRFKKDGTSYGKIEDHVHFDVVLDLEPYTSAKGKENSKLMYDLYAVVVHRGPTPNSGHYFSYVRSDEKVWHLMDDAEVFSVSEEYVLAQQAYMLFYAKQGTGWFSSIVENEQRVLEPKSIDNTQDFGYSQMDHYNLVDATDTDWLYANDDDSMRANAGRFSKSIEKNEERALKSKSLDFTQDFGCSKMDHYIVPEVTHKDLTCANDDDSMRANDSDSTHGIDTDSPDGKEKTASDMEEEECDSASANDKDSKDANEKSVSGMDGEGCDLADANDDKDSKDAHEKSLSDTDGEECDLVDANDGNDSKVANVKSVSGMDGEECDLAHANDDKDSKDANENGTDGEECDLAHANDDKDSKDANEKSVSGTDGEECDLADANDDKDSKDANEKSASDTDGEECDLAHANDDKDSKDANEKSLSGTDGEECDLGEAGDDNDSKDANDSKAKDANEKSLSGTNGEECDLADAGDDNDSKDANDDNDSRMQMM